MWIFISQNPYMEEEQKLYSHGNHQIRIRLTRQEILDIGSIGRKSIHHGPLIIARQKSSAEARFSESVKNVHFEKFWVSEREPHNKENSF